MNLIYPMAVLVFFTGFVVLRLFKARGHAIKSGAVEAEYFRTFQPPAEGLPRTMVLYDRLYHNLLEMPVLFYAGCLTAMLTGIGGWLVVVLAWLYVALRLGHAAILLAGKIRWRVRLFGASFFCLMGLWAVIVGTLLARSF